MKPTTSMLPQTPAGALSPLPSAVPGAARWLAPLFPGVWQLCCGMHKEGLLLLAAGGGLAVGAVLTGWQTWDSFALDLMFFRGLLGLGMLGGLQVRTPPQRLVLHVLAPEFTVVRAVNGWRAVVPVLLMGCLTAGLVAARLSTKTHPAAGTWQARASEQVYRNEEDRLSMHFPLGWSPEEHAVWPTLMTAHNSAGTCHAKVWFTHAPPLPPVLEDFYISRILAHHLGHTLAQREDSMTVSMFPARQWVTQSASSLSQVTAAHRDWAWVAMDLRASAEGSATLDACARDFSLLRGTWMLW